MDLAKALVFSFLLACLARPLAADWFVISDTHDDQASAQKAAANDGGWVLPAALYPQLKSAAYDVVRGPFADKAAANKALQFMQSGGYHKKASMHDAGSCILPTFGHGQAGAAMMAALLGELSVKVSEHAGGSNPCEPQEPYRSIELGYVGAKRTENGTKSTDEVIDFGGFWIIQSSGVIEHMRICTE